MAERTRVDVWLWAVRLFKTRSLATTAVRGGHVRVNDQPVKPAANIVPGDTIRALTPGGERIVVVERLIQKRTNAPTAQACYLDVTPAPPPKTERVVVAQRERGTGRPTKRERRQLDQFLAAHQQRKR